ncbi:MAG TPA: hypothetical protein VMP08_10560 [Anaerolineae bacterium]|nr:hypothetical protein [Anaerolineae bacterium]
MVDRLDSALLALRNGERNKARSILADILRSNPKNELAWYWLAACVDSAEQKKDCLSRALALNPNNRQAKTDLEKLEHNVTVPDNKTVDFRQANTLTMSELANPNRPADVNARALSRKTEKFGGLKGEIWVGIGTLIMLVSCIVLSIIGVYSVAHMGSDFPASDPTQFKKATGKYQFVEVFTDW